MPKYTPERIEEIRGHLADLERRKIPVSQLAREVGVAEWTVYCWKRRFGRERTPTAGRTVADLVEVVGGPPTSTIDIVVGEMTVRVPPGCGADDLERVLRAVRAC